MVSTLFFNIIYFVHAFCLLFYSADHAFKMRVVCSLMQASGAISKYIIISIAGDLTAQTWTHTKAVCATLDFCEAKEELSG
jgi:hypothetical protein